jgi:catechol 2,3-dioxygenase-like lactoylglutathione lyase family enzyme
MTEDTSMEVPIANHHIHFYTSSVDDTKAWYVKMFGAKPGKRADRLRRPTCRA